MDLSSPVTMQTAFQKLDAIKNVTIGNEAATGPP